MPVIYYIMSNVNSALDGFKMACSVLVLRSPIQSNRITITTTTTDALQSSRDSVSIQAVWSRNILEKMVENLWGTEPLGLHPLLRGATPTLLHINNITHYLVHDIYSIYMCHLFFLYLHHFLWLCGLTASRLVHKERE